MRVSAPCYQTSFVTCPTMPRATPRGVEVGWRGTTATGMPPMQPLHDALVRGLGQIGRLAAAVQDHRAHGDVPPRQGLDGEGDVVEGAETGARHHHRLEAEAHGEVGGGEAPGQGHEHAARALHEHAVARGAQRGHPLFHRPGIQGHVGALGGHRGRQGLCEL